MPGLIPQPRSIWLAVEPVDMRLGADGLSLYVQQVLRAAPCDGSAYLFGNRRGNRLKLLVWDGEWRLAVPAPPAPGAFRLAQAGRGAVFPDVRAVAMAGGGGGLAAFVGLAARPFKTLKKTCKKPLKYSIHECLRGVPVV